MSRPFRPAMSFASWRIGISISTSLPEVSRRTLADCANPTTATSRILGVLLVRFVGRVGLVDRLEIADALEGRRELFFRHPHRLDPHARADLVELAALDEREERQVGTIEQHVRARERRRY